MLKLISLSVVLCMSAMAAQAQIRIIPREKLEAVASPRLSSDSSSLSFNARLIEAGSMREDSAPEVFKYEMTNVGREPINVLRLQTTCSCVTATIGQNKLKPGEKTSLSVRYDPKGHLGRFEHKVFVYTQEGNAPAAALRLVVEVESGSDLAGSYQVHMGRIALRNRTVTFRKDVKSVETLNFVNLSGRSLKLECEDMFLPQCISFHTEPAVLDDGQEGEIVISYDPSKGLPGARVPLILKNLGVSPGASTINITFE